jgi:hypothetical protein
MTLTQFLETTSTVPASQLRLAMVRALAAEPARTPEALHRFYGRVAEQLDLALYMRRTPAAGHRYPEEVRQGTRRRGRRALSSSRANPSCGAASTSA